MLQHNQIPFFILAFSLSFPFAFHDAIANSVDGTFLLHNTLTFLGFTFSKKDREARLAATLFINAFENVPQFCIVIFEIFNYGYSTNFVQAFNPIFTVFMIYKGMGEVVGLVFYE